MNNKPTTATVIIILVTLIAAGYLLYANRIGLKLVPTPERFTELYFNNYSAIPKNTTANKPFTFSFTISNREGATTAYPYTVFFKDPSGTVDVFASNSVTLTDNTSSTVVISHTFVATGETGEIVVNLTQLNQQIDLLLPGSP
jgi:hypothetical protein